MNEKLISQFEKEYYERPPEPCNDTENPEQWTSVLNWQVAYTDWLENQLKNLGEGEAGTGYALLSDVRLLIDSVYCLIKNGIGDCICYDERGVRKYNVDCPKCENETEIKNVINNIDKVKAHF